MGASEELQRWAGRACMVLAAAMGLIGYHYANVRFLPIIVGLTILAVVCYLPRAASARQPLRESGQHPAI